MRLSVIAQRLLRQLTERRQQVDARAPCAVFGDDCCRFGSTSVRVATITPDQRVHLVKVVIERDAGATIQIASGLHGDEHVVRLGAAALSEGERVSAKALPTPDREKPAPASEKKPAP